MEEIRQKLAELERWHTNNVNAKIKNVFANTSTLICHNCDHKDEYIEELETQVDQCREAVERMKPKKADIGQDYYYGSAYECPNCGSFIRYVDDSEGVLYTHCEWCGQLVDCEDE